MQSPWRSLTAWPGRTGPAVLYAVIVFGGSVVPPPSSGISPAGPFGLVGADKWLHAATYAAFVVLVVYALWTVTPRLLVVAVVVASAYGAGLEVVQSFLPLRSFDLLDMLANVLGALLAGVVLWVLSRRSALPWEKRIRSD
ncbi:VanZ family protein [Halorientalis brevis]|uniref:VanZ family protein n=1 Tax=Halorientalis brevis TaxID=1126241 RepID=UPI0036D284B7